MTTPTQVERPWRATVRTAFAILVALATLAPVLYAGATLTDPSQATGLAAQVLAVAAAVTRILALPGVESFLQRFVPWLAADVDPGARSRWPIAGERGAGELLQIMLVALGVFVGLLFWHVTTAVIFDGDDGQQGDAITEGSGNDTERSRWP